MDEDLVFDACHVMRKCNISFDQKKAVIQFAVYASAGAAEKGARPIQDSLPVRFDGDQFDALASALFGGVEKDVQNLIEKAVKKQDNSPNKKEKFAWVN